MFRYSSSSSVPKSPGQSSTAGSATSPPPPGVTPPVDPLPLNGSRPSDILISRCHEIKRISKMLAAYFEGLSVAHLTHSTTLLKLSDPKLIQTPLAESSLFLPAATATASSVNGSTANGSTSGSRGGGGWAELLQQTKETNKLVAEEHASLAKNLNKNVVTPLKKIRTDMKLHISTMEKEVTKLAEVVTKEREQSAIVLTSLSNSINSAGLPLSTLASDPAQDPVLLRAAAAAQIKQQVIKENELLAAVLSWTTKTETREKETWREINRCWGIWEQANSNLLLSNQQRSMMLSAGVDGVAPETEWNHFQRLNHTIPAETPMRSPDEVTYTGRDDPLTEPIKEGLLDRQSRILKSWKPAFYLLTPSGNLHSYATSASPIAAPMSSLNLALCSLGPMPVPAEPSAKGKGLEAMFVIAEQDGTRHILRAKSWEELSAWWIELEKFTKPLSTPTSPVPRTGPTEAIGHDPTLEEDDHAAAVSEAMEEEHPAQGEVDDDEDAFSPTRSRTASSEGGDLGSPSPSTPRKKSIGAGVGPPALPPRSEVGTPTKMTRDEAEAGEGEVMVI